MCVAVQPEVELTRESSQTESEPPLLYFQMSCAAALNLSFILGRLTPPRRRGAGDSNACRWTVNAMRCAHSEFFDDATAFLWHPWAKTTARSTWVFEGLKIMNYRPLITAQDVDVRATLCARQRVTPFWEAHLSTAIMLMAVFYTSLCWMSDLLVASNFFVAREVIYIKIDTQIRLTLVYRFISPHSFMTDEEVCSVCCSCRRQFAFTIIVSSARKLKIKLYKHAAPFTLCLNFLSLMTLIW